MFIHIIGCIFADMIARILKSSGSFPAVNYSEKKLELGKAELLGTYNFALLEGSSIKDYIAFLNKVANGGNKDYKNVQFHATISAEGKNTSKEELQSIAEDWMQKMGYGAQPYMLFFHNDTANNHVHIISSRIDLNGNRINPSFEGERAVRYIDEIMKQDLIAKAQSDILSVLKDYQFSTVAQARLLFEQMGWKTAQKDDTINLIKNGRVQGNIKVQQLKNKGENIIIDEKRKAQLSAILHKYKDGLSLIELQSVLKKKFGLDLVLHTAKGHTIPYGYTLIDNAKKTVYKGSEIMPLKELLTPVNKEDKLSKAKDIVQLHLSDKITYSQLRKELYAVGYKLNVKGEIGLKGEKNKLFMLLPEVMKRLRYNERLAEANQYHCKTNQEAKILARIFYVKATDLIIDSNFSNKMPKDYSDILHSVDGRLNLDKQMKDRGYELFCDRENTFLIDKTEHTIVDVSDFERVRESAHILDDNAIRQYADGIDNEPSFVAGVAAVLSGLDGDNVEQDYNENMRRRQRKMPKKL